MSLLLWFYFFPFPFLCLSFLCLFFFPYLIREKGQSEKERHHNG
jgi:hypothetical protein